MTLPALGNLAGELAGGGPCKYGTPTFGVYNGGIAGGGYSIGLFGTWDNVAFAKYGSPIVSPSLGSAYFDNFSVHAPSIIEDASGLKVYYGGRNATNYGGIGVAVETGGGFFGKLSTGPVIGLGASGAWDDTHLYFAFVAYDPTDSDSTQRYKCWYSATTTGSYNLGGITGGALSIGYAYSSDGETWTKYSGNPVLTPGSSGAWDGKHVYGPMVVKVSTSSYVMFYDGIPMTSSTGGEGDSLGIATFTDPKSSYTKSGSNPLLAPSVSAQTTISATVTAGASIIPVTSSSAFNVGEPIFVTQGGKLENHRVESIPDSTHLGLDGNLVNSSYTSGALCNSVFSQAIGPPRSIWTNSTGGLVISLAGVPFGSTIQCEASCAIVSASGSLTGPWEPDYSLGLLIPVNAPSGAPWDFNSAENPSVVSAFS